MFFKLKRISITIVGIKLEVISCLLKLCIHSFLITYFSAFDRSKHQEMTVYLFCVTYFPSAHNHYGSSNSTWQFIIWKDSLLSLRLQKSFETLQLRLSLGYLTSHLFLWPLLLSSSLVHLKNCMKISCILC